MKENPFSTIVEMMQAQGAKHNTPPINIAKVIDVIESDTQVTNLTIEVNDLPIDKDNIYISDFLLKEYEREVRTEHSMPYSIYTRDTLRKGDLVAVMPLSDKQTYIILTRVRRL